MLEVTALATAPLALTQTSYNLQLSFHKNGTLDQCAFQFAPRLVSQGDQLNEVVLRQHGEQSAIFKTLQQARRMPDQSLRSLWAVYLTSPAILWG